jgi:hypothetical protein
VLATQEVEVSHELANAFQLLDYWYRSMSTSYNRLLAAERRLEGVEAEYEADRKELEFLLQAQTRYAAAEAAYFRSVVEYNKAVAEIHLRKGTLLENNNIHLAEGAWTPEAYKDALRRAWARTYAFDAAFFDPVHSEPQSLIDNTPFENPDVGGPSPAVESGEWELERPQSPVSALPQEQRPGVKPAIRQPGGTPVHWKGAEASAWREQLSSERDRSHTRPVRSVIPEAVDGAELPTE